MAYTESSGFTNYSDKLKKMRSYIRINILLAASLALSALSSCGNFQEDNYKDNSPTSGKLKVYYDEGLQPHVQNQVLTFEAQYSQVQVELVAVPEAEAVRALYNDSCESIIISRLLTNDEKTAFKSKDFFPRYSMVAKSGVALITNIKTPLDNLSYQQVIDLLTQSYTSTDSIGNAVAMKVLFDKNNSSVVRYLSDTILQGKSFSSECNILSSSVESINYVAQHKNTIAFIDYAWLSDVDDSLYKANLNKIKLIGVKAVNGASYEYPSQSSFKLNTYPFTRSVYVYRKTGDYTLAKGFESFVVGPKGQLTFLKQGLLPARQAERKIEISTKPISEE